MSKLEIISFAALALMLDIALVAVALWIDPSSRGWLEGGLGLASAVAWAASACAFKSATLAARISLVAAVLAGAVCVVAIAPGGRAHGSGERLSATADPFAPGRR